MQVLYTEEKFSELKKQIGRRERLLLVSSFLFLAVIAAVLLTDNHNMAAAVSHTLLYVGTFQKHQCHDVTGLLQCLITNLI